MSFEDDLSAVEEHVAEARRMVQRQKGLIVRLEAIGVSTLDAQRILWLLESNLRRLENHRDFLKANFGSALMTSGRSRPVFHRTTCFPPVIGQTVTQPALILHEAPFAHFHCRANSAGRPISGGAGLPARRAVGFLDDLTVLP